MKLLRTSRVVRTLVAVCALVAVAGVAACARQTDSEQPPEEVRAPAADHRDGHHFRGHHFRGPVRVAIETALEHGDLSADQHASVERLAADLSAQAGDRHEMRRQLRATAIDVVRVGSSNSDQYEQAIEAAAEAIERRVRVSSDAVKELHAILDADQRSVVADRLRERLEERWQGRHRGHRGHRFKQIAKHLALTSLQIDKLKLLRDQFMDKRERLRPTRDELHALLDAFETDDFDQALDRLTAAKSELLRERLASAGENADAVLSLLGVVQRELLADLIERGPPAALKGDG